MEDLVITGSGVISPAVDGVTGLWEAMADRRTFFTTLGPPRGEGGPSWPLAEVREADLSWPAAAEWADVRKYANTSSHLAVTVAAMAMRGNESLRDRDPRRSGVVIAAGGGGSDELDRVMPRIAVLSLTDPRPLPKLLYDEVPDYSYIRGIPVQMGQFVSMISGFQGANAAVNGEAGVGGLGALALAVRLVDSGELDRVLVVGVAPRLSCAGLASLNNDDPFATDSGIGAGPFDVERAGTIAGQGAASVLIERAGAARERDAVPTARLLACETICAADRRTAAATAVRLVVDQAGRDPGCWWAHGAGSPALDLDECQAVVPEIGTVPVTSSKGTIGNAFDCSALIDTALTVESLNRAQLPPVGLLRKPDPALGDIDPVLDEPRAVEDDQAALVTAFTHGRGTAMAGAVMLRQGKLDD
jgi:3-oxoacyl-[acyl-carrier-protein] synthase II